jgi:hypothetical protein
MEPSLQALRPADVMIYIRVRNGVGIQQKHIREGLCARCSQQPQSEAHLLWECTGTLANRIAFQAATRLVAPRSWLQLAALPPRLAFHYLLGAGSKTAPATEWVMFQKEAVRLVSEIFS